MDNQSSFVHGTSAWKRVLSFCMALALVFTLIPATIFTANAAAIPSGKVLYLKPNANWLKDGARFAAYFFGNGEKWVSMTDSDGDGYYEVTVPSGGYTSVIFCRMSGSATANNWNNKWNQTSDLTVDGNNNCYTVKEGTWDKGGGTWSNYAPVVETEPVVTEPTPTVPVTPIEVDYYLVGFINGADYGCEADHENLGDYKFVDGTLTATFESDSYVFIKTGDNAHWYLFETYCEAATGTLIENASEKMFVPGGVEITFTLEVNDDGTLTLSYETAECLHDYDDGVVTTSPTCLEAGSKIYTCSKCGDCYTVILDATGHNHVGKETTAATCTEAGVMTYTCSNCGDTYTEQINPNGHSFSNGKCSVCGAVDPNCDHSYTSKVTTDPTCLGTGVKLYTCSKCGDVYEEEIPATGHDYEDTIVPPTCENNGYTIHSCKNCNYSYNDTPVNPIGHDYSSVVTPPTCTEKGYTTYTCGNCGNVYTWNETPAAGHSYVSGICNACGEADPDYVEPVVDYYLVGFINGTDYGCEADHENLGQYKFVDGTLTATFETDSYVFIKTGDNAHWYLFETYCEATTGTLIENASEKMLVPGGVEITFTLVVNDDNTLTLSYVAAETECSHEYDEGLVTTEPTCTGTGLKLYTCSKCGTTYTEVLPAAGHSFVDGVCSVCGAKDPDYVEPSDPVEVDYYLIGYINGADYGCEADYENLGDYKFVNGTLTATFETDSYVFVKTGDNAHWYLFETYCEATSGTLIENATEKMIVPGGVEITFTLAVNDDNTLTLSYVAAETECSHEYDEGLVTTEPTCTGTGLKLYTCSKCGATYTEVLPATGHNFVDGVCSVCGAKDPDYVEPSDPVEVDYYLVGFINGADYGCEADHENLGQYKFADGKLTATFETDSYVFVKTGDNAHWYLFETYCEATTGTLIENASEKMLVPGGVEITFTLVVNDDNTLTLSYVTAEAPHEHNHTAEVTTEPGCETEGVKTFTCECGDTYTESIPAAGHSYVDGTCSVCGAKDPDYVEPSEPSEGGYAQVTDITEITAGGQFVIVAAVDGGYKALDTSIAGKISAVDVTVENGLVIGENLPVWNVEPSNNGVALSCSTGYLGYASSTNFAASDVSYAWSVTAGDNGFSFVSTVATTRGIYYQISGNRFGAYATSNANKSDYVSQLLLFKYAEGTTEPDVPVVNDYYLFGYINGADYGCEADYENLGQYKFVDGTLTAIFETDSYVAVKTGDNAHWYLFETYCEATTGTLIENASEKMLVPGGVEITFTLVVNDDNTLTLSYVAAETECSHEYDEGLVTTEPTCTGTGLKLYTCSKCGATYTEVLPATGHSFVDGVCSVCGAKDPDYVEPSDPTVVDYYLVGFINGADYGCEADHENLGQYKFVDGTLTATFETDSYVFVKTGDNAHWYLFETYCEAATGTLIENASEKMFVPGGVEITFTLVVNDDNTLTLSYVTAEAPHEHNHTAEVTTEPGCETEGVKTFTCECGDTYTESIPAAGHSYVDGTCSVCGAKDPDYVEPSDPTVVDYYLVGFINGADYGCEADHENLGQYKFVDGTLTATFETDSYVFVKTGDNAHWYLFETYCEATTGTLIENASEKMLVPGGVEITFTLVENEDGTLTLSYTTAAEPVTGSITLSGVTLSLEDEVLYNLYFTTSDMTVSAENMGLLVWNSEPTNATINGGATVIPGATASGSTYMVQTEGIPGKNLGDTLYLVAYAQLDNGAYVYSKVLPYSAKSYCMSRLEKSSDAKLKALCVALLNYGAAAQEYFAATSNYTYSTLMNADLTAEQQALVQAYNSSMMAPRGTVTAAKAGVFGTTNNGYSMRSASMSADGIFSINYYFTTANATSNVTMYYWNEADFNAVSELTVDNATGSKEMTPTGTANQFWADIDGIAAKDLDKTIYACGVYTVDGTTYSTGVIPYSLGYYCSNKAENGGAEIKPMAAATAVYSYYAKLYFNK